MKLFDSVPFNPISAKLSGEIREKMEELWELIRKTPRSPERTIAQRKLEECGMWVNKGISRNQD